MTRFNIIAHGHLQMGPPMSLFMRTWITMTKENWPSRNQPLSGDFGTLGGVNSTVKPKLEVNIQQTECQGEVDIRSVDFGVVNAFDTSQWGILLQIQDIVI